MNHHLKYKFGITFGIYIKAIVCVVLEDLLQAILCEHFCTTFSHQPHVHYVVS